MYPTIAKWAIKPGSELQAIAALINLAEDVKNNEDNTLVYMVHIPNLNGFNTDPKPLQTEVVFFEVYRDEAALNAHINGPVFTGFVKTNGDLFEKDDKGNVKMSVETLSHIAGFARNGI
jgi:quinol monooxygenase YgiN